MEEKAKELRAQGMTYREIGKRLGVNHGKVWALCNRKDYNVNVRESTERYKARGRTPLWQGDED